MQLSGEIHSDMQASAAERRARMQVQQQQTAEIQRLARRDHEVRAHEQAHAAVGGAHAGAPVYQLQRGPNGVNYAVGGHVHIDVSPVEGDPKATLDKMQQVQRAAMAPMNPSPQDRAVAAQAAQQAAQARAELAEQRTLKLTTEEGTKGAQIDILA